VSPTDPRRVYVSAASRGLGFSIARTFFRQGAEVALSSRSSAHLAAARSTLMGERPGGRVLCIEADLGRIEDQERAFGILQSEGFAPDVFVCGAGQPPDVSLEGLTREQWVYDLEMVLGQAVFGAQRFAPAMAERGYGRLVFISSTVAKSPQRGFITSSIPRAGLLALNKVLSQQYAAQHVASFVVHLGFVDTPLLRNMALGRPWEGPAPENPDEGNLPAWDEQFQKWAAEIPARRIGSPDELAEIVAHLATPAAEYLAGSTLSFAGGLDAFLL
jgi:3-oxoacyl-[acyl-carrier protein] reductase